MEQFETTGAGDLGSQEMSEKSAILGNSAIVVGSGCGAIARPGSARFQGMVTIIADVCKLLQTLRLRVFLCSRQRMAGTEVLCHSPSEPYTFICLRVKVWLSRLRGRAVRRASHDSLSLGRFVLQ
jgi:hypothetical protein